MSKSFLLLFFKKEESFLSSLAIRIIAGLTLAGLGAGEASAAQCAGRVNDTPAKLLQCIQQKSLWKHLSVFQQIADQHPDQAGHGNRDVGTPGYKASVHYVARLMRRAGYTVTIQSYNYKDFRLLGTPSFGTQAGAYVLGQDWFVARLSGAGHLSARVSPAAGSGCQEADFAAFVPGNIALLPRADCTFDTQVRNAQKAGAAAVILYNRAGGSGGAFAAKLVHEAAIPVIGVVSQQVGQDLLRRYAAGHAAIARLDVETQIGASRTDYNLIADSPFGDPNHVVVVEGHLDSIYGAGMLDNASGSTTILEIALQMARTPTHNQLRYVWFGGEEIGLLGSAYYTTHLSQAELHRIVFDLDADVTATPNFDILVADPANAFNVHKFPPNVVPRSRIGNKYFLDYFNSAGLAARPASFGNDGTDSNSFSLVGVPNSGILTQQDCCKTQAEVDIWGGFLGDYEGKLQDYHGSCVDQPNRWCDNLSNNDPFVLTFVSKGFAYVTFKLANDASLRHGG